MALKILLISLIFHIIALIFLFSFGIASLTSIAIVASLTMTLNFFVLLFFWGRMNKQKGIEMLSIFDGAFTGWVEYLKLGIPSAVMCVSEFWIFEVMTVMAAYEGPTALATISVITNILSVGYETTGGLSSAMTSLIGRLLGEEKPD